jgi:hypothetical protein
MLVAPQLGVNRNMNRGLAVMTSSVRAPRIEETR